MFLAEDSILERNVAIKFLPDELQHDPVARGRFEREAKSAAALDHPFICKIYEFTEVDGRAAIVMEHVAGQTLESRLADGPLAPAEAIQLGAEVVEALSEAHAHRILHRDLKPANLMLTGQGHVKVMDFGLAKRMRDPGVSDSEESTAGNLTRTGMLLGTPAYMAPEQVRGGSVDARSDIFSFGVVLFELLTGEHPFKRGTVSDMIAAILRDAPTRADGSGDQVDYAIFDKLLAKTPDDRYQSFDEVSVEVRRLRDATSAWTEPLSEPADTTQPPVGARRTPFVGRDDERAELGRWLDRAVRGRGGLVLVGGEPGVGKTRLVEQLLEVAQQQRCLALTGRCYEIEGTAPFIPFVEIIEQYARVAPLEVLRETLGDAAPEVARLVPDLRRLIPNIQPAVELPPEQQRHYLFKNVAEFLERVSRVSSTVLLLDDLQWADHTTLLLLQHLAPSLERWPVLMLGTYRDVELEVTRPFAATLETLNRKRLAQRLNLQRLPESGVASMLAALGGPSPPKTLVAAIYRETEGNPFFVEEVFEHLREEGVLQGDDGNWRPNVDLEDLDVPEGVRLVIGRRLERVSPDSRKVLTFGAVVGRGFSLELLEAIGDVIGDALLMALEEAEANHLIMPMPGRAPRWEFSHALIRQTLAAGLSLPRRQRLHLKVAEAMERAAGSSPDKHASDLAHHLFQAGTAVDPAKTVRFLTIAGDQALAAGAFDESLRHLDHALELVDEADLATRAGLLFTRGRAMTSLGLTEQSFVDLLQAAVLYETAGDFDSVGKTCGPIAAQAILRADFQKPLPAFRRGLALVGDHVSASRCQLLAATGGLLAVAGDCEEGPPMLRNALLAAEALGDDRILAEVFLQKVFSHWAYMTGGEWAEEGRRGADLLWQVGDLWNWVLTASYWKVGCEFAGRLQEAAEDLERVQEVADRLGHSMAQTIAGVARGFREFVKTGDIHQFRAWAEWYRDLNQRLDYPWDFVAQGHLGLCHFWRGEWKRAPECFESALRGEMARPSVFFAWGNFFMMLSYAADPRALELLASKQETFPKDRPVNGVGSWVALMRGIEGLAVLERRDEVAELYPLTLRAIDTGTVIEFFSMTMPRLAAGIAAASGEQWDAAEEHYRTGLRQTHEVPHRLMQPELRRWYARMLIDRNASGDRDKARTLLGEAVEVYQQIDMPRHVEMAKEMLKTV